MNEDHSYQIILNVYPGKMFSFVETGDHLVVFTLTSEIPLLHRSAAERLLGNTSKILSPITTILTADPSSHLMLLDYF